MADRKSRRWLLAMFGLLPFFGCELFPHRKTETTDKASPDDVHSVGSDETKSFHRNNRLAGGLSDQAREIESHFNIQ